MDITGAALPRRASAVLRPNSRSIRSRSIHVHNIRSRNIRSRSIGAGRARLTGRRRLPRRLSAVHRPRRLPIGVLRRPRRAEMAEGAVAGMHRAAEAVIRAEAAAMRVAAEGVKYVSRCYNRSELRRL